MIGKTRAVRLLFLVDSLVIQSCGIVKNNWIIDALGMQRIKMPHKSAESVTWIPQRLVQWGLHLSLCFVHLHWSPDLSPFLVFVLLLLMLNNAEVVYDHTALHALDLI